MRISDRLVPAVTSHGCGTMLELPNLTKCVCVWGGGVSIKVFMGYTLIKECLTFKL